ncbi:MAG: aminotransferase class V-fold PLP-dependent enzyme [Spirochaetes bacterium]|nr:MAG: aminotransferase class V-fold PLP-dependent enzyme [Spirochaetota bacterium]
MAVKDTDFWQFVRSNIIGRNKLIRTPFGERIVTYADYTASGRGLDFVEHYMHYVMEEYANTHTDDDTTGEVMTQRLHRAEHIIKEHVHANEDYKIIEVGSGSTGAINRLQEILGVYIPPATRKRLEEIYRGYFNGKDADEFYEFYMAHRPVAFVGPYEHHSNEITWRECFTEVVEIHLSKTGEIDLDDLYKKVSDKKYKERVKIGSFSAASNVTGIVTPVYDVAGILHENGAYAFFDFAASAPYVKIDVNRDKKSYFDAVFYSPHKFLGGPGSCGVLVFRKQLYHSELPPSYSGGGTVDFVNYDLTKYSNAIEVREKPGTPPILQTLRAALAMEIKDKLGIEDIKERENSLIRKVFDHFSGIPQVEILGNPDPEKRIAIFSFNIKDGRSYLHPRFVIKLLNDLFGIQGRAGCACAGPYGHRLLNIDRDKSMEIYKEIIDRGNMGVKPGWARVNFHYLMTDEEVNFLMNAIDFVSAYGKYFLGLYAFNIKTGSWSRAEKMRDLWVDNGRFGVDEALDVFQSSIYTEGKKKERMDGEALKSIYKEYLEEAGKLGRRLKSSFNEENLRTTSREFIPYLYCAITP